MQIIDIHKWQDEFLFDQIPDDSVEINYPVSKWAGNLTAEWISPGHLIAIQLNDRTAWHFFVVVEQNWTGSRNWRKESPVSQSLVIEVDQLTYSIAPAGMRTYS